MRKDNTIAGLAYRPLRPGSQDRPGAVQQLLGAYPLEAKQAAPAALLFRPFGTFSGRIALFVIAILSYLTWILRSVNMGISDRPQSATRAQGHKAVGKLRPASAGLPPFDMCGKRVLEVGCSTGIDLTHSAYAEASERCGIDIDVKAIETGRARYPELDLRVARGEAIPFRDGYFDAVLSRIALPYMDIPAALVEFNRVMRPGAYLFASWHDWEGRQTWLLNPTQGLTWKRAADLAYIVAASIAYRLSGRILARPWNGTRETFQFRKHIPLMLTAAGFVDVACERNDHHLRSTARKPEDPNRTANADARIH